MVIKYERRSVMGLGTAPNLKYIRFEEEWV